MACRPLAPATVLYEALRREGYGGHYEGVKRWVRERRREQAARRRACVRFETSSGELLVNDEPVGSMDEEEVEQETIKKHVRKPAKQG